MSLLRVQHRQSSEVLLLAFFLTGIGTFTLYAQQSGTALIFYAQPKVSDDLWPAFFEVLRADLQEGAGELPGAVLDTDPILVRGSDDLLGVTFSKVITVRLIGRCDVLPQADRPSLQGPLGWVLQVAGKIQPGVSIDCARLAQVLRHAVAGLSKEERRYVMVQAMAHVLIHEWIHISTQSSVHGGHGVMQANLSVNELIASPGNKHLAAARH